MRALRSAGNWLRSHVWVPIVVLLAAGAGAGGTYLLIDEDTPEQKIATGSPAPRVILREAPVAEETTEVGFPAFATKNTTRVAGADPAANAAAVALAVHPSTGDVRGPAAVTLVDSEDWQAGIAAASLAAEPVSAPVLITTGGEVPELTASALADLDPRGAAATAGRQVFSLGAAAQPEGFDSLAIEGDDPAALAVEIASLRERLGGKPAHILLVSDDDPSLAMPAAGWAARSGDPVLFVERDSVPEPTLKALRKYRDVPVYVLGPESAVSAKAMKEIEKLVPGVQRIGDEDPVVNAIDFARYASGSFGWNINDPGHGFVIARADRPLDAAAAAPLSGSGTWGPLLLSDDGKAVPEALDRYLLDLKPGYASNPTRAVYNHVWLIGDEEALSVDFQARVDQLAELAPVTSGTGVDTLGPPPGTPESQPEPDRDRER